MSHRVSTLRYIAGLLAFLALPALAGPPVEQLPFSMLPDEEAATKSGVERIEPRFPNQVAEGFEHLVTARSHGQWRHYTRDGREFVGWEYAARLAGAVDLSVLIDRITLPEGARLHITNPEGARYTARESNIRESGV